MSLLCRVGRHMAGPQIIVNAGIHFAWCAHCGCDLILGPYRWGSVPKGHRVVWKRRRNGVEALPEQLELDFSALPRASEGGARRRRRQKGRRPAESFGMRSSRDPVQKSAALESHG